MNYVKSVLREFLPAWLVPKAPHVDARPSEQQPPVRELIGAAPPRRYRGPSGRNPTIIGHTARKCSGVEIISRPTMLARHCALEQKW